MTKPFTYSLDKNASKVHKEVVNILKRDCPGWNISQNHSIKIDDKTLYADIYCNSPFNFIIEIHGQQHYKFVKHFHGNMQNFKMAQSNDQLKKDWCEMNGFCYIEVPVKSFRKENFVNFIMGKIKEYLDEESKST